jgi:hypothetical protein
MKILPRKIATNVEAILSVRCLLCDVPRHDFGESTNEKWTIFLGYQSPIFLSFLDGWQPTKICRLPLRFGFKLEFEKVFLFQTANKTVGCFRTSRQICRRSNGEFCFKNWPQGKFIMVLPTSRPKTTYALTP